MINDKSCLPNFFIVGAAKAGTTSLVNYLSQHPDIYFPALKEPKYFSAASNMFPHNGPNDRAVDALVVKELPKYLELFNEAEGYKARGEASVDYLYFKEVSSRIHSLISNAKIIIMLRNPVDRAFSAYSHMIRDQRETLPFVEALRCEKDRKMDNWEFFWLYQEVGFYSQQVKVYLDTFGPDLVSVFLFEDFIRNPRNICQNIFRLLSVDSKFVPDVSKKINVSGKPKSSVFHFLFNKKNMLKSIIRPLLSERVRKSIKFQIDSRNIKKMQLDDSIRQDLLKLYWDDILLLQDILKKDLSVWLQY